AIGHSTRPLDEFLGRLRAHGVTHVVDTRTVPRSRRNPQYNREALPEALRPAEIGYAHVPGLGGLRRPRRDSVNTAWRNAGFRGYADYMQTPEFAESLETLIALATREHVAVMCAEAVPWRCHRSLIADPPALPRRRPPSGTRTSPTPSGGPGRRRPPGPRRQPGRSTPRTPTPSRGLPQERQDRLVEPRVVPVVGVRLAPDGIPAPDVPHV